MRGLPNALSALRLALAPVLLALAWSGAPRAFVCRLALSLMTDIADGRIAELEEIAITAVLPAWHANVPSLVHALGLRRGLAARL